MAVSRASCTERRSRLRSYHGLMFRQTNLYVSDMADDRQNPSPGTTPQALADRQARAEREAAALRENLRRRKQQARAREAATAPDEPPPQAD